MLLLGFDLREEIKAGGTSGWSKERVLLASQRYLSCFRPSGAFECPNQVSAEPWSSLPVATGHIKSKWSAPCALTSIYTYKAELCAPSHLHHQILLWRNLQFWTAAFTRGCSRQAVMKMLLWEVFPQNSENGSVVFSYLWLRGSRGRSPWVREPFPKWRTHQRPRSHNGRTPCCCPFQWEGRGKGHRSSPRRCHRWRRQWWRFHWWRPSGHRF